jgi:hypothetical protein
MLRPVPWDPRDPANTASNAQVVARAPIVHPQYVERGISHLVSNDVQDGPVPFEIRPVHSSAFQTRRHHRFAYESNALWYWRRLFANTSIQTSFRAHKLQNDNRYSKGSQMLPTPRYTKVVAYPRSVSSPQQYGPSDNQPPKIRETGWIRTVEGIRWKLGGRA